MWDRTKVCTRSVKLKLPRKFIHGWWPSQSGAEALYRNIPPVRVSPLSAGLRETVALRRVEQAVAFWAKPTANRYHGTNNPPPSLARENPLPSPASSTVHD